MYWLGQVQQRTAWLKDSTRQPVKRWLVRLLTGYLTVNGVLGVLFPFLLLFPPRREITTAQDVRLISELRANGFQVDAIGFVTSDGVTIRGWMMWPNGECVSTSRKTAAAVILIHGRTANRRQTLPYARFLAQAGFPVLLYDSRGQGQSSDHACTYGLTERRDVKAAIDFLRLKYGIERVGLLGLSMGAAIALQAAAEYQAVGAVVADSPFASLRSAADHYGSIWGWLPHWATWPARAIAYPVAEAMADLSLSDVSPERAADHIRAPVLLIHGQADWRIPAVHSQRIYRRLAGRRELWLVPQAGHTRVHRMFPSQYERRVIRFLQSAF